MFHWHEFFSFSLEIDYYRTNLYVLCIIIVKYFKYIFQVNEKSVGSSFPVDCNTIDYAQKVAAKHALTALKKQYGESVIYPITNDINTMASCVKTVLQ